jgi:hypothetical protein
MVVMMIAMMMVIPTDSQIGNGHEATFKDKNVEISRSHHDEREKIILPINAKLIKNIPRSTRPCLLKKLANTTSGYGVSMRSLWEISEKRNQSRT